MMARCRSGSSHRQWSSAFEIRYDEAAFAKLMRTGKAPGDRELPMMSGVARGRFVHFTEDEVCDLYSFLRRQIAGGAP